MPAFAVSTVSLIGQSPFERSGQATDQTARIQVDPADGVSSLDLFFHYDPAFLTPTAVFRTAFTDRYTLGYDLGTPGAVEIHLFGATPLAGTGDVAWVTFRVIGSASSAGSLTWDSAVLNAGAIGSTTQVARDIVVETSNITVSIPDSIQALPGTTVLVNISATSFVFVSSMDLFLRYNQDVIEVTSTTAVTSPFSPPLGLTCNNRDTLGNYVSPAGYLRCTLFGSNSVSGSGPVLKITFSVTGSLGSSTPLNLDRVRMEGHVKIADDGTLSVCPASCDDGDACTTDSCVLGQCVHQPGPPAGSPVLVLKWQPGGPLLTWSTLLSATSYDVVRGRLDLLLGNAGNLTPAVDACVASDLVGSSVQDTTPPSAGSQFWYLVRPVSCGGPGTYDSGSPKQVGPRDPWIGASPNACP